MFQTDLFTERESLGISINVVANDIGVSTATIRNWIKTGYLNQIGKGVIDKNSLLHFMSKVAGKEKLLSRANKLLKDTHNHNELTSILNEKLITTSVDVETLGNDYENSLSDSYRNKEGIYYTPQNIVADMLKGIPLNPNEKTFCDPSCGSGNFIIEALERGFKPENVFGFDIDPNAVAITKKRIFEKTGYKSKNIIEADFLEMISTSQEYEFEYIFTNPPWGKKLAKTEKERFGSIFKTGKSLDTSALFFFACLKILKNGGQLGFLLPESFFNISTFKSARNKALTLKIDRLIDYDKPFKGLVTKAQAIVLTNNKIQNNDYLIKCENPKKAFSRSGYSFVSNPKSILNFWLDDESSEVIGHILNLPHISLLNNASWGLGIVTGNNKKYCKSQQLANHIPVFKGSDIQNSELKEPSNFIPKDTSKYQQVASIHYYEAKEKLIYKFISSRLSFFCDTQKRYLLNSANMLIPKKEFPITCKQLCDLFNSEFINWLFQNIFKTHKILRSDLEAIPIHSEYFKTKSSFNEYDYLDFLNIRKTSNGTYRIKR